MTQRTYGGRVGRESDVTANVEITITAGAAHIVSIINDRAEKAFFAGKTYLEFCDHIQSQQLIEQGFSDVDMRQAWVVLNAWSACQLSVIQLLRVYRYREESEGIG
jgi:hypothetical protein